MSFKANDVIKMVKNDYRDVVETTCECSDNDFDKVDDLKYKVMDTFNNER